MTPSWLSQYVPAYAVAEFGREWLAARVTQHTIRVRFPGAGNGHALPQSESVNAERVREASEAGPTHHHKPAVRQAGGER